MKTFEEFLDDIAKRPGMYVGTFTLRAVDNYISGYNNALWDQGLGEDAPFTGFQTWVELRFLISNSAWHWTRILVHVYGSQEAALGALPDLFKEFRAQRALLGNDGIEAEHHRRLMAEYGTTWHEPSSTTTTSAD